jgi:hypothetical protein
MANWEDGRFITDWSDPSEVAKLLALMPVQAAARLPRDEEIQRRVTLYNVFGIGAVGVEDGIEFDPGVGPEDQPLHAALDALFVRRFPRTSSDDLLQG